MANFRYFVDFEGATAELKKVVHRGRKNGRDVFEGLDPFTNKLVPITRVIKMKSYPTKHECDTRCIHAKGRTMQCECSCGGKNHGKGG